MQGAPSKSSISENSQNRLFDRPKHLLSLWRQARAQFRPAEKQRRPILLSEPASSGVDQGA